MFSFKDKGGLPVAKINRTIVFLNKDEDNNRNNEHSEEGYEDSYSNQSSEEDTEGFSEFNTNQKIEPLLDMENRSVAYIAGPSGSGKSSFAVMLIKRFLNVRRDCPFYLFSRTSYKLDPVFAGMKINQVMVDESIISEPIDITKELVGGCIVLFDDVTTIQDDKLKKAVDKLLADILEVGRKLRIWIVVTNHLVIPNEKKVARTILNEMHSLTVFPKSGSSQQIFYALKQYFGLAKDQVDKIMKLPSRWVMIHKHFPMFVVHEKGIYLL